MSEQPLISIVVPTYNVEKYIGQCIDSLINQTWNNIEIIIIDDGSEDKTREIVNKYSIYDKRIKFYLQDNSGPSVARNNGISKSSGEYITFCDADDNVSTLYIEELVKKAQQDNYDIVTCGYIDISKYGKVECNDFYDKNSELNRHKFIDCIFKGVGGTVWGKLFKRNIIIENNIKMNKDIFMCEDMVFVLEYSIKCRKYGALEGNLYNYNRLNENSISKKLNLMYYNNLISVIENIEAILKKNKFDQKYIDRILSERVKNLSYMFFVSQHNKKYNYTNQEKINNIKIIINNEYYKKYKNQFNMNILKEEIVAFLVIKNKLKLLNLYTMYIYKMQNFKDKLKGIA